MIAKRLRSPGDRWTRYIGWWRIAGYLLFIVAGFICLIAISADAARWGWLGLLGGVGIGGLLAEFFTIWVRREDANRHHELLEMARSRARAAYRIGEFFFEALVAIEANNFNDYRVIEVLDRSEILGIEGAIKRLLDRISPDDLDLYGKINDEILAAILYAGEDTHIFFTLGKDLLALRGEDALANADARNLVASRVSENLASISGLMAPLNPAGVWRRFAHLWQTDCLTNTQIAFLLQLFHRYLRTLGTEQLGGREFAQGIAILKGLRADNIEQLIAKVPEYEPSK